MNNYLQELIAERFGPVTPPPPPLMQASAESISALLTELYADADEVAS